jgi:hypothetical protein
MIGVRWRLPTSQVSNRLWFRDHYSYHKPLDVALSVDDGNPVSGFFKVMDTPNCPF